ncbi:SPT46 protein, partial [Polyodon spathula]|nr:SPT46 protein [Polyodon spathula]
MGGEVHYKCASCLRYFRSLGFLQTHIVNSWKEGFSCKVFYQKLKEIQGKRHLKRSQENFMLPATKIQHFSPLIGTGAPSRSSKTKVSWDLSEVKRKTDAIQKWLLEIQ